MVVVVGGLLCGWVVVWVGCCVGGWLCRWVVVVGGCGGWLWWVNNL